MNLKVENENLAGWSAVRVTGEVDLANSADLGDYLSRIAKEQRQDVALDMNGIQFIDSSGLNMLMGVRHLLLSHGCTLTLLSPTPPVSRALQVTGFDKVFEIYSKVPRASTVAK